MTKPQELKQNTPEWFEARKNRITGSQAGALLGLSPFVSKQQAIKVLQGEDLSVSEFQQRIFDYGHRMEKEAIALFELETGLTVKPCGFFAFQDWLGASPDGLVEDNYVIEVKCPYSLRNDDDPKFKQLTEMQHYYAQVQIEMYCAGRDKAFFVQYASGRIQIESIEIDYPYLIKIFPVLYKLWVQYVYVENSDVNLLHKYMSNKETIKELQEENKNILEKVSKNGACFIGSYEIKETVRTGSIDYKKAIKELNIQADFEPYRKPDSKFFSVACYA